MTKTRLLILVTLLAAAGLLFAQNSQQVGPVQTSQFIRQFLTNETASGALLKLNGLTNGLVQNITVSNSTVTSSAINNSTITGGNATIFVDNVAALQALNPVTVTNVVRTKGYFTPGDGGDGSYFVTNSAAGANGGSIVASTNNASYAFRLINSDGIVRLRQWGAKTDGTDVSSNIQSALTSSSFGSALLVDGNFSIGSTLTMVNNRVRLYGEAGLANGNVKPSLRWIGATNGTMISVTASACAIDGITLDANGLASTCVQFNAGEHHRIKDCLLLAYTGDGLKVGNGGANNNNFLGENLRFLYNNGAHGILVSAAATENIVFRTVAMGPNSGSATNYLIKTMGGPHVTFHDLIIDDDVLKDYAIQINGTASFYNLTSECKQTLQFVANSRGRGCVIQTADLRSQSPQSGQFAIDITSSGNEEIPVIINGVHVENLSGAAVVPRIQVNNGTVISLGTWWTETGTSPGKGSFLTTSTGHLFDLSRYGSIQNTALTYDSNSSVTNNGKAYMVLAHFKGVPWVDVKAYGALGNGVANDYSAITNAIANAGTGGTVFFPAPGDYIITNTIAVTGKVRLMSFSGGPNDSASGARIRWAGEASATMMTVSGGGTVIDGLIIDGGALASTCVNFSSGDSYQINNSYLRNYVGTGLIVGSGSGNNNGFSSSNLKMFYASGGGGISINAASATDLLSFRNIEIGPVSGGLTPGVLVVVSGGHADFYNLSVNDSGNLADYAIKVAGSGTIGINGLTAITRQALQISGSAMERPNVIQRAELRNINPTASEFAMRLEGVGTNPEQTFILNGVKVSNLSGAAVRPNIQIAVASSVVAQGVWFTETGTSPGKGTITNSASGHIMSIGTNSILETLTLRSGMSPNGGGFKHSRVTTGAIATGVSGLVTNTWSTAFADTSYTVSHSLLNTNNADLGLRFLTLESISTTNVVARITNTSAGTLTGTLHLQAVHD